MRGWMVRIQKTPMTKNSKGTIGNYDNCEGIVILCCLRFYHYPLKFLRPFSLLPLTLALLRPFAVLSVAPAVPLAFCAAITNPWKS